MNKYTGFLVGLALMSLVAFRPWGAINHALGIHRPALAADTLYRQADSLFVEQPATIVLPAPVTDSLADKVYQQGKHRAYLEEQSAHLADEEAKFSRLVEKRKKEVLKKQQTLLDLDRIEALVAGQKHPPTPTAGERPSTHP